MNFLGEKCAACGSTFTDTDDVVVCPECGSPHHRDCYKSAGACANSELHSEGFKWKRISVAEKPRTDYTGIVLCPLCHYPNRSDESSCTRCGADLADAASAGSDQDEHKTSDDPFARYMEGETGMSRPYLGFDPDEDMGGATLKEVSQFVCTNTIYYIPIFKKMKDTGSKISFNIICLLLPPVYFANRKMWGWALLTSIIMTLLLIPGMVLSMPLVMESGASTDRVNEIISNHEHILTTLDSIFTSVFWGLRIVLCLFGNRIYFKYVLRSLKKLKTESNGDVNPQLIMSEGGVKPINIFLIVILLCVMSTAGSTAVLNYLG